MEAVTNGGLYEWFYNTLYYQRGDMNTEQGGELD